MTRYLVDDISIQDAIHNVIKTQDKDPQGTNYVIESSMDVVKDVLKRLDRYKVAEAEQTENSKQDSGREIDTIDYPVVDLGVIKAADLVDIICRAYHNGLAE